MRTQAPKSADGSFNRDKLADTLFDGLRSLSLQLSQKQFEKLLDYLTLLHKWNGVYNLTAVREPQAMVVQHLLDSLAAVPAFEKSQHVLDVGSGGGLPGIVLAIARPDMKVELIDTVQKKTAFLSQVKAELHLNNVVVHTGRVESLKSDQPFDTITSRAFASLADMVHLSHHLLSSDGHYIAMKGTMPEEEMADLSEDWNVFKVKDLKVPGMKAERHLVFIERKGS